jgi:hypothetical protein
MHDDTDDAVRLLANKIVALKVSRILERQGCRRSLIHSSPMPDWAKARLIQILSEASCD